MAFLPNIPQPTDQLSVSQGNLLNNFQILGAIAGNANTSSASINATSGFNWLYLPVQGANPPAGAAFAAGQIGLYSFQQPNTGNNELYINKLTTGGTLRQIPMTAGELNPDGWTYLPSGLLLKFGSFTINPPNPITQNFPVAGTIPVFNTIYQVIICNSSPVNGDSNQYTRIVSFNTTSLTMWSTQRTTSTASSAVVRYLAIGI